MQAQQHTLGERLAITRRRPAPRAMRKATLSARRRARQQQVGNVGAGNQQTHRGQNHQHLQTLAGLRCSMLNAPAAGRDHDVHALG